MIDLALYQAELDRVRKSLTTTAAALGLETDINKAVQAALDAYLAELHKERAA